MKEGEDPRQPGATYPGPPYPTPPRPVIREDVAARIAVALPIYIMIALMGYFVYVVSRDHDREQFNWNTPPPPQQGGMAICPHCGRAFTVLPYPPSPRKGGTGDLPDHGKDHGNTPQDAPAPSLLPGPGRGWPGSRSPLGSGGVADAASPPAAGAVPLQRLG